MRLDFNVIWVEDQVERVQAQSQNIRRQLLEYGFEFKPIFCTSITEAKEQVALLAKEDIDLILVDWDLGNREKGDDAIVEIREIFTYKDVIFYSANSNVDDLRVLMFNKGIDGVFCTSRSDLVVDTVGVTENLINKVLDLDHTRGIVMGATCDIDALVINSVEIISQIIDDDEKTQFSDSILNTVEKRLTANSEKLNELRGNPALENILEHHDIVTANDRLRALVRALEYQTLKHLNESRPHVIDYMQNVVPKRNKLGHLVISVADIKDGEFSLKNMRDLRIQLLQLRDHFRQLHKSLTPKN